MTIWDYKPWDLVEIRGSWPENEWRIYNINYDKQEVFVVSKIGREYTTSFNNIVGKLSEAK